MKKLFFSLVAAMMAATASFAQSTLVATLTHGENVTMYYGTYALRDAYNASASGDVINLSGGGFQGIDINKGITLRGTGIDEALPTQILNEFNINIPSDDANRFLMEGIRCAKRIYLRGSFANPYFLKCQLYNVCFYDNPNIRNAMFVDSKITNDDSYITGTNTVQFVNCYVTGFRNYSEQTSNASFINCVIRPVYGYGISDLKACQLVNSIIYNNSGSNGSALPTSSIATNCVAINNNGRLGNFFNNGQTNPNCGYAVYSEMFKDFTGEYSDSQTFELSEEGKKRAQGTDGTEVGMYGGSMPYTSIPSYPRITKMNVASKTTADGKLSVEIEVSAAQ
jgi:hypothetical protein